MVVINPLSDYMKRRHLRRALEDYPIYSPPYTGDSEAWCERKMISNHTFFCENKAHRLKALQAFFSGFSIDLSRGLQSAGDIGGWLHSYGCHGLNRCVPLYKALHEFDPCWSGEYKILNLVFDLSIFTGELVIAEYSIARWGLLTQESSGGITDLPGYGQTCLFGVADDGYGYPVDLPGKVFCCLEGAVRRQRHGFGFSELDQPDGLRHLILYLSGNIAAAD